MIIIAKNKVKQKLTQHIYQKISWNNAITGSFALHGTNGVKIIVICFSLSFSIVLDAIIAGTLQPRTYNKRY